MTCDGKPVDGGSIIFWPLDRSQANWGVGRLGANGRFVLRSLQVGAQLQPGRYTIFFRPPAPKPEFVTRRSRMEELEKDPVRPAPAPPKFPIPVKLTHWETSDLSVTLTREPSRVDIDLKTDQTDPKAGN